MIKPRTIICDLDGTLAIHNGRGPFDYDKCDTDLVNEPVSDVVFAMIESGMADQVIYLSGRPNSCREKSESWLYHACAARGPLMMRETGDYRNDAIVKEEIYRRDIEPRYNVILILDDRDRVVNMWRSLGLTCLQVEPGNF